MTAPMKVSDKERQKHELTHTHRSELGPVLREGTRTQHESSQKPGHQQGQVQRCTDDAHGLLLYEPGG